MFARGRFAGRSGQIFIVPREGDIITSRDEIYRFTHGTPWDYDARIPFLLHGAPFVRQGEYRDAVGQEDVAPTLAAILGVPPAATMDRQPLLQAIDPKAGKPAVVLLLVLDGMRADYFERYADRMPTLTRLRREGAWFAEARTRVLPTVTSVGHATIGTGADPWVHGESSNTMFNYVTGESQEAYGKELDPRELMALTIGDLWNIATDGRAIIIGQGGANRATAGLLGHGACLLNGRPVIAQSYNSGDGGWETNATCYRLPDYMKQIQAKTYWTAAGGTWMGHKIDSAKTFRASSLFQRFEGDALIALIEHESIGADDIPDLLLVNLKAPDYIGHAYGPDAPETQATLTELDSQVKRVLDALVTKVKAKSIFTVITADHGMAAEPQPGRRHYGDEIVTLLHARFDPEGRLVKQYASDPASGQIYLDRERLTSLGYTLVDVAAFLEKQDFIAAAFTEDDVIGALPTHLGDRSR
jgi:predicted AlkP superfamily pyrophosphatase or phosphodiesterase